MHFISIKNNFIQNVSSAKIEVFFFETNPIGVTDKLNMKINILFNIFILLGLLAK